MSDRQDVSMREGLFSTLVEGEPEPRAPKETTLVYIGSPINDFADAGGHHSLTGVRSVHFVRGSGSRLDVHVAQVGDARELEIAIPSRWVSATHARLDAMGADRYDLLDCGSRNGTLVEGHRIHEVTSVRSGDVIEVGRSFWMLREDRLSSKRVGLAGLATANPEVASLLRALERVAASDVPLLMLGETGVGKNELAEAIHRRSGRPGPMVSVNVMAESDRARLVGELADQARGGTLLLDDVGELSTEGQAELLAALMARGIPEQIRVIATSTRDLRQMVQMQAFRADLYARLAGYEARLPPLRDRREDLGLLVQQFARRGDQPVPIAAAVFRDMLGHDWPFNLRELKHAIESAVALTDEGATIDMSVWDHVVWRAADLPSPARIAAVRHELVAQLSTHRGDTSAVAASLRCEIDDVERWLFRFSIEPERYAASG